MAVCRRRRRRKTKRRMRRGKKKKKEEGKIDSDGKKMGSNTLLIMFGNGRRPLWRLFIYPQ